MQRKNILFSMIGDGLKENDNIIAWAYAILSHALLRLAEANPYVLDLFWLNPDADLLLNLLQSSQ
ncbi:hypothetical protein R6Q59_021664 [Mikania micrantha]